VLAIEVFCVAFLLASRFVSSLPFKRFSLLDLSELDYAVIFIQVEVMIGGVGFTQRSGAAQVKYSSTLY